MPRPKGRISGLRRVKLPNGESARYRPVGYRGPDGRFHTRNPNNGHWRSAKGRHPGRPPTPSELKASDVVNWEVHYGTTVYYFASEGGVPWAGS